MAVWDFFRSAKKASPIYAYHSQNLVQEDFKGKVVQKEVKLPSDVGEVHPFNFAVTEGIYANFGLATGVVDKLVDFIWGPGFHTKSDNPKAKKIIDDWVKQVSFLNVGRRFTREGLVKGTGFLELAGNSNQAPQEIKLLDSKYMYVERDEVGNIKGFTQYFGGNRVVAGKTEMTKFKPEQVVYLPINPIGDCPYGYGVIYPSLNSINYLLKNEKDLHVLMGRKANAPIVAYCGKPDGSEIPAQGDIEALGNKMTYMNNRTEWAFSTNVHFEVLDFGNIGGKFDTVLQHDTDMLFFGFQVPEVLMGRGSIPEGLAQVQMDAFERRVRSYQAELEEVIENSIFKRILKANKIDAEVELVWGEPSESEVNSKVALMQTLISSPMLSTSLRAELEKKVALLLDIDPDLIKEDPKPTLETAPENNNKQPSLPGQSGPHEFYEGELCRFAQ